jgi:glycosyltransferase involved in cell wall biosynthesis
VKGCDLLIRAFARVAAPNLRFHLVIAGPDEGGLRPRLELLARELGIHNRITWTGQIEGAVKWGAFRAAEVFALPSHTENYGHAVVEAMACGVPVLITNKVNIWNEISADCAGFVEDDDLDGICALLSKWVLLDENQRNALRQKARNCFLERFDIDAFSLRLAQYLETVIFAPLPNSREVVNHG